MEVEIGRGKKGAGPTASTTSPSCPAGARATPTTWTSPGSSARTALPLPLLASAMDGVVDPGFAVAMGGSAGWRCSTSRACRPATRTPTSSSSAIAALPKETATRTMQEIYQEPIKPELIARASSEIKDGGVVAAASLTPQRVQQYYRIALEAGLDVLVIQGTVVSAEHVSTKVEPLEPEGVHRRAAGAGGRRRRAPRIHHAAPHAHRRRRRARRRRPGPRLHHARRARHRRAAGDGHRRRRRRARPAHARDGRVLQRHRRRRHAHRRRHSQGHRPGRRRRHDRLAAGLRQRGAGPRLSLGHGDLPPELPARHARQGAASRARWRRSSSARRTRTTARSTCSAPCARRMATCGYDDAAGLPEGRGHGGAGAQTEGKKLQREQDVGMGE